MTLADLKEVLVSEGIPTNWYLLENHGIKEDKICIETDASTICIRFYFCHYCRRIWIYWRIGAHHFIYDNDD